MARACYDPVAAPSMLKKLHAKEKQLEQRGVAPSVPLFLRTHPLTEDRLSLVQSELAEAYKMLRPAQERV